MPRLPQPVGTVEPCRFILLLVDACKGGHIDNACEPYALPKRSADKDPPKHARLTQKIAAWTAKKGDKLRHGACGRKEIPNNPRHDHHRYEERHVADRLDDPLKIDIPQFVEHQCKNYGHWEVEQQVVKADQKCITNNPVEVVGAEKISKMPEPYPITVPKTSMDVEVLERHAYTDHG